MRNFLLERWIGSKPIHWVDLVELDSAQGFILFFVFLLIIAYRKVVELDNID